MRGRIGRRGGRIALALLLGLAPLAAESLFTAETLADGTLYSDQVARRVGDLITIRVVERMSMSDEQETETSRETTIDAGFDAFPNSARIAPQDQAATAPHE